jgi:RNA polymerase sigma factor (sigma-70 family)
VSTTAGKIALGIVTAGAHGAAAASDEARSPAAVTHPPGQQRRTGVTNRGRRAPRPTANPVRDDPVVIDLVTRAGNGDEQAWVTLVERYSPLIWSICCRHQLGAAAEDIGQTVWLQLVDQLDRIRDPAALPGWLVTTTRRECLRVVGAARGPRAAGYVMDAEAVPDEQAGTAEEELLAAERHAALLEAFRDLPPCDQRLILLLIEDPPVPYAEISARLGIPIGSIGPTRRRCLDKLRHHPAIAALISTDGGAA